MEITAIKTKFNEILKEYLSDVKLQKHPFLFISPDDPIIKLNEFISTEENKLQATIIVSMDQYLERSNKLLTGYNLSRQKNKQEAIKFFNEVAGSQKELTTNLTKLKQDTAILNEQNNAIHQEQRNNIQKEYINKLKELTNEKIILEENYNKNITICEDEKNNNENNLKEELRTALDNYASLKDEANWGHQVELNKLIPNKENYYNNLSIEKAILEKTIKDQVGSTNKYINDTSAELDLFFKKQELNFKEKYSNVFEEKKLDLEKIISLSSTNQEIKSLLTDRVLLINQQKEVTNKNNLDELTAFFREYKHFKMLVPLAKRELFQKTNIFHNKNLELSNDAFNKTEKLQIELIELTNKIKLNNLEKHISLKKNSREYDTYINNAGYQNNTQLEQLNYKYAIKKNDLEEEIARLKFIVEKKRLFFLLTQKKDNNKFLITKEEFSNEIETNTLNLKRELNMQLLKKKNIIALYNQKIGEAKNYFDARSQVADIISEIINHVSKNTNNSIEANITNIIYLINYINPLHQNLPYMSERLLFYLDLIEEYIKNATQDLSSIITRFNTFIIEFFSVNIKKILDEDLAYIQEMISMQLNYISDIISKSIDGLEREKSENKTEISRLTVIIQSRENQISKYLAQLKKLSLINLDKIRDTEETYKSSYQKLDLELRINKVRLNNLLGKDLYYQKILPKFNAINTKQQVLVANFKVALEKLAHEFKLSLIKIAENINSDQILFKDSLDDILQKSKDCCKQISLVQNNKEMLPKKVAQFIKILRDPYTLITSFITNKTTIIKKTISYYYKLLNTIKNDACEMLNKIKSDQLDLSNSRESSFNNDIKLMTKLKKDYMHSIIANNNLSIANKENINNKEKNELIYQIKKLNQDINNLTTLKNSEQKIIKLNIDSLKTNYLNHYNEKDLEISKEYNQIEKELQNKLNNTKKKMQDVEYTLEKHYILTYEKFINDKDIIQAKLKKDLDSSENNLNTMIYLLNDKNEQVKSHINKEISVINQKLKKLGYSEK